MFEFEQRNLPNATAVLILGILSILSCICYGIFGVILGVVALVLFKKDKALYDANPSIYSNYSNLNAGRILAIIGLVLSILYLMIIIWMFAYIGWEAFQNPELMREKLEQLQ
ncbi:CCC motif membrane protein [Tenacibaculum agarivorans]|uniref:CCC motif membrane protein n=1 Tax=Tenacibaculum agarivorans TaxID=1908389 RepID=UPI00094B8C8C|nr:CCC motif membrane protein [Tenacibaculum agarivorans]